MNENNYYLRIENIVTFETVFIFVLKTASNKKFGEHKQTLRFPII